MKTSAKLGTRYGCSAELDAMEQNWIIFWSFGLERGGRWKNQFDSVESGAVVNATGRCDRRAEITSIGRFKALTETIFLNNANSPHPQAPVRQTDHRTNGRPFRWAENVFIENRRNPVDLDPNPYWNRSGEYSGTTRDLQNERMESRKALRDLTQKTGEA